MYRDPMLQNFQNLAPVSALILDYGAAASANATRNGKAANGTSDLVVDLWNGAANGTNMSNGLYAVVVNIATLDYTSDETYQVIVQNDASATTVLTAPNLAVSRKILAATGVGRYLMFIRPEHRYLSLQFVLANTTPEITTGLCYAAPIPFAG